MLSASVRHAWLGVATAIVAMLLMASPGVLERPRTAHAEQIRARCVRELAATQAWSADVTETEVGTDGTRRTTRQQLVVRQPGEYRITLYERDTDGREVVSTAVRTPDEYHVRRTNADGTTELHVIRGVRPSLGVELDNLLGQTVQAVADAVPLRIVSSSQRGGRPADKLELGPGRFVWVDRASGLPIEEQVVSGGMVVHSVVVSRFDADARPSDDEFDPASLGEADAVTVEDLGFRAVEDGSVAETAIGFVPLRVPAPDGYSADVQGYVDPRVPNGDAPVEGAFVHAFSNGSRGVVVTQAARPGFGDSFVPTEDETAFERIDVGGAQGALFRDAGRARLVFARRDILVTVEGDLSRFQMAALAQGIR